MREYRYNKHQKVEDSTKGKSDINPRTYKRDVLMQVWLQSRHLATLLKWLEDGGSVIRFRSEIVQITLEQVVEHLVNTDAVKMVEYAEDAQKMLERFGVESNPSGRGGKNAFHNLTLDNRMRENRSDDHSGHSGYSFTDEHLKDEDIPRQSKGDKQPEPEQPKSNRAIDNIDEGEVLRLMEKREDEAIRKRAEEEKERVLANADIDENGVITPHAFLDDNPRGIVGEEFMEKVKEEQRVIDEAEKEKRKETKAVKKRNKERERLAKRLEELGEDEDEEDVEDSCMVRKRPDEEILVERVKKDKEQERSVKMELSEVSSNDIGGVDNEDTNRGKE